MSQTRKRPWMKRLVMFCIGVAIGSVAVNAWDGHWKDVLEWGIALFFAIGWRVEMQNSDEERSDGEYWKSLWLNSESTKSYENAFSNSEPPVLDDPEKKDA